MTSFALRPRTRRPRLAEGAGIQLLALCVVSSALLLTLTQGHAISRIPLVAVGGVAVAAAFMVLNQRVGVSLIVLAVFIGAVEGPLRLGTGVGAVTAGRDILLDALVAGMLIRWISSRRPADIPPIAPVILAYVALVLVEVFNPGNETFSRALVASRQHLLWVPLFFVGYLVVRDARALRTFLVVLLVIAAANGIASTLQFNLTPEQLAGWGPGYASRVFGTDGAGARYFWDQQGTIRVRPFGLGSDFGTGGFVGVLAVAAGIALLTLARTRKSAVVVAAPLLALSVAAIVTSQARSAVLGGIIAVLAFAALGTLSRRGLAVMLALVVGAFVGYGLVSTIAGSAEQGSFDRYRTITPSHLVDTVVNYRRDTIGILPDYIERYPLGAGLGVVGPASTFRTSQVFGRNLNGESQLTFLVLELGVAGLILLTGLLLYFVWLVVARVKRIPDRETRILLAAVGAPFITMIPFWITGITTTSPPLGPYFWFAGGVLVYWLARRPPTRTGSSAPFSA